MKKKLDFIFKHKLKVVLGFIWLILFLSGLFAYEGTTFVYVIFSVVFSLMLFSGIHKQVSYGYLFLVIFLWLGFWFKLTASYFLSGGLPFIFEEAVGNFNKSIGAWDQVLWIATCACMGVMLARFIYASFRSKHSYKEVQAKAPEWYLAIRVWLWIIVPIALVAVASFNVVYGIHQIGITPRTILFWPLNALISWMLNIGFALMFSAMIWWDMAEKRGIALQLCAILFEGFVASISVISRSMFLFHVLPQILVFTRTKDVAKPLSRKLILLFFAAFVVLFLFSIAAVSVVRDHQYQESMPNLLSDNNAVTIKSGDLVQTEELATYDESPPPAHSSFRFKLIRQLVVNRWIGMEGVMAVASYPKKSDLLFWKMLMEKREAGKVSAYQQISNSTYQAADGLHQFASLPGPAAFFFYSGSLVVVIVGMTALTLLMMVIERGLFILTKNPLFCTLFGMTAANTIAQFGITPRQDMPYYLTIVLFAILIFFLQSKVFASMLKWFNFDTSKKQ